MNRLLTMLIPLLALAAASAAEPLALAEARAAYQAAVERATAPLRDKYLAELEKLQKSLTTQGKLEEAMTVKHARLVEVLAGNWTIMGTDKKEWPFLLYPDGTARMPHVAGRWSIKENTVIIQWADGWEHHFTAEENSKNPGMSKDPKGRKFAAVIKKRR